MTVDLEMFCDRCGCHHEVVWFAPSDIWNAVMRGGDRGKPDEYGFCCPNCFLRLASERGIDTTGWLITPFDDGPVMRANDIRLVTHQADVDFADQPLRQVVTYVPEARLAKVPALVDDAIQLCDQHISEEQRKETQHRIIEWAKAWDAE